jgi:transposase-like protein
MNLIEFQLKYSSEEACIKDLEIRRWGENNAICPFCKSNHFCKHNTRHIYTCMDCKKQYSVRIGTIFESSRLPLNKWYLAIYLFTSLKKGISSHQLSKYLSITQKSAWFMLQRIREVMKNDNNNKFDGTTEIDEAYLGGSETNKHADKKNKTEKTCIIGLVNRDTKQVKAYKVSSNEKDNLLPKIYLNCKDKSNIFTDSYNGYDDLKKHYNHEFVKHCAGEYNRYKKDDSGRTAYKINTNSIEGFWSQLKRGIYGVYHWASNKHIQRYVNEFAFRYNNRLMNDIEIFTNWFGGCENKRLYYKVLIG